MSPTPSATLMVRDLELSRGERRLFSGLTFDVAGGELAIVTGANGAGKTTLLRTLAGLRPAAAGSVTYGGTDVGRLARGLTAPLAFQGHQDGLKRELTVAENLRFVGGLWNGQETPSTVATDLGLEDCWTRQVRTLSAGQRRRAALGCLRMRSAAFWLLDEPLTNLDAAGEALVADWLDRHLEAGGAAVVATHQPDKLSRRATLEVDL